MLHEKRVISPFDDDGDGDGDGGDDDDDDERKHGAQFFFEI